MGRVAYGISNRVDRVGSLGNAVVPQIPEMIGRAILNSLNPRPS
jgi:DNA (cytosine-5)-methyltransferase 1